MRYRGQGYRGERSDRARAPAIARHAAICAPLSRPSTLNNTAAPSQTMWSCSAGRCAPNSLSATPPTIAIAPAATAMPETMHPLVEQRSSRNIAARRMDRSALRDGEIVSGPALIIDAGTTILVPSDFVAEVLRRRPLARCRPRARWLQNQTVGGGRRMSFSSTRRQILWSRLIPWSKSRRARS